MPTPVAVAAYVLLTLWLLAREKKLRPMTSPFLWIPLLWVMIIGSRSVSLWTGERVDPDLATAAYLEGSPLDRNIFLLLIIAALVVLYRRGVTIGKAASANRCLFAYFLYFGVSILWSDFPLPSFKGWIKDLGNFIMVLTLVTETDYHAAIKGLFHRYIIVVVPLSALLILFFPDIGSYYALSTSEFLYCGVTMNKNELGQILMISGLFLVSDLFERSPSGTSKNKLDILVCTALLGVVIWLLLLARSSTSIGSLVLGSFLLVSMQLAPIRNQVRHLGVYTLGMLSLILFVNIPIVLEILVELLGRDMTFTGRTEIWHKLLAEPINPILGSGFKSFWLSPGTMESYGYINQAHNGYLETYLNGGWLGLFFLIALIFSVGIKVKNDVIQDSRLGVLLFVFLAINIFVNITEAMFDKLNLIWFVFLLASVDRCLSAKTAGANVAYEGTSLAARQRLLRNRATERCPSPR